MYAVNMCVVDKKLVDSDCSHTYKTDTVQCHKTGPIKKREQRRTTFEKQRGRQKEFTN